MSVGREAHLLRHRKLLPRIISIPASRAQELLSSVPSYNKDDMEEDGSNSWNFRMGSVSCNNQVTVTE